MVHANFVLTNRVVSRKKKSSDVPKVLLFVQMISRPRSGNGRRQRFSKSAKVSGRQKFAKKDAHRGNRSGR